MNFMSSYRMTHMPTEVVDPTFNKSKVKKDGVLDHGVSYIVSRVTISDPCGTYIKESFYKKCIYITPTSNCVYESVYRFQSPCPFRLPLYPLETNIRLIK